MIELLVLQKYLLRRLTDAKFAADVVWLESFLEASSISCLSRVTHPPLAYPCPSKRTILIVRCVCGLVTNMIVAMYHTARCVIIIMHDTTQKLFRITFFEY